QAQTQALPTPPGVVAPVPAPPSVVTRMPSKAEAFALVYPTSKSLVVWDGRTNYVRFSPQAVYNLGNNTFLLTTTSHNLDDSFQASEGFYRIPYLGYYPALTVEGTPFIGVGRTAGWGASPAVHLRTDLSGRPTLQVDSSASGQGETDAWTDLVALGPAVSDV